MLFTPDLFPTMAVRGGAARHGVGVTVLSSPVSLRALAPRTLPSPFSSVASFHMLLISACGELRTSLGVGFVFFSVNRSSTILHDTLARVFLQ